MYPKEVPVATRRRRDIEKYGPWRASSKLPSEERPTRYRAVGLQAAREAAGMTVEEVAQACGYPAAVIRSMESGTAEYHTLSISRASSVIPNHNLSEIRDEG
jgi:ribosome-binding protein aMBF1 (putative translation factor)